MVMMGAGAGPGAGTLWQGRQLGSCGRNSLFPTLLPSQQCGRPPGPPEAPSPRRVLCAHRLLSHGLVGRRFGFTTDRCGFSQVRGLTFLQEQK